MRMFILFLFLSSYCGLVAGPAIASPQDESEETQAVIDRANDLNRLLDRLLDPSNHSSFQRSISSNDDTEDPFIAEALRLKEAGEQLLANESYIEAAISLQAALDNVFQAIRARPGQSGAHADVQARIAAAKDVNDTFLSTANRIVGDEPNPEAVDLLDLAGRERARAESSISNGDLETALKAIENSTHTAQQAIMSARDGKVIERGQ